ncbi:MAG: 4-hydroxythreonine-4-phosphate dehydrogenase PdxA [Clostridiales bacterium]|nr:4-hydroxythreonine-4-phosphate dehydrogenase PdxA [Clostridiales bacterium]
MKPIIGITMGDPAGVGPEIAIKALARREAHEDCVPVIIGDYAALEAANRLCSRGLALRRLERAGDAAGQPGAAEVIDMALPGAAGFEYGKVQKLCGEAAFRYVEKAIALAMAGELHAVATGPINKEAINLAGHHYSGHTEIFAERTGTADYAMLLMGGGLRVIHATTHCSLREACDLVTRERVLKTIQLAREGLSLLGLDSPKIGVAGLNPHASENGLFGSEEARAIAPAVEDARRMGICAEGPVPPDTVFVKCRAGQYDVVVAMYHDQGHIPLKLCGFRMDIKTGLYESISGVNCTIGLPIIRTSVDHGTGFDRAWQNRANEESLIDAIRAGAAMARAKHGLR